MANNWECVRGTQICEACSKDLTEFLRGASIGYEGIKRTPEKVQQDVK